MADKFRQIQRYTEILNHLARDCDWANTSAVNATSRAGKRAKEASQLHIVDMGCGKGYLTFAAWHLFSGRLRHSTSVQGIEARADLVAKANEVARQENAEGLEFVRGDIASAALTRVDVLIALHACNTATDDAIRRGISLGAKLILVAPCCHQALRSELGAPELLASLLQHGLFKERLSE